MDSTLPVLCLENAGLSGAWDNEKAVFGRRGL